MDKLFKYELKEFFPNFLTIFLILGIIISLIFIISISNMTSSFQITFLELVKMYLLTLPQIIFLSISIAFFIASVNEFAKLSETQELIAMFALGIKPLKILRPIILLSILFSFINLFILFISIPYSKVAFNNFKSQKKQEAKFNLQSAKISQKFGNWVLFASRSQNKKSFENIYLYNNKKNELILAKNANLNTQKNVLNFNLYKGNFYNFDKNLKINYQKMQINQKISNISISIFNFKNYFLYNRKVFVKYLPFALIPIALLFFIPFLSFFHPRLHKNKSLVFSISILSIYIILTFVNKHLSMAILLPFVFFVMGIFLYKWRIKF